MSQSSGDCSVFALGSSMIIVTKWWGFTFQTLKVAQSCRDKSGRRVVMCDIRHVQRIKNYYVCSQTPSAMSIWLNGLFPVFYGRKNKPQFLGDMRLLAPLLEQQRRSGRRTLDCRSPVAVPCKHTATFHLRLCISGQAAIILQSSERILGIHIWIVSADMISYPGITESNCTQSNMYFACRGMEKVLLFLLNYRIAEVVPLAANTGSLRWPSRTGKPRCPWKSPGVATRIPGRPPGWPTPPQTRSPPHGGSWGEETRPIPVNSMAKSEAAIKYTMWENIKKKKKKGIYCWSCCRDYAKKERKERVPIMAGRAVFVKG